MNTVSKLLEDASRHELVYCLDEYDEALRIMKILHEGLEEIASDDSSEGEVALEILQSMEDKCKQSNWRATNIIPEKLREMD